MATFFVDIDSYGDSLARLISPEYNPCLIEVSEKYLKCLTNRGTIEFDIERGELSKINRRFPITDVSMLPELFQYEYDYFFQNLQLDRGILILSIKEWFKGFLKGGPKGLGAAVYNSSEGKFDYEKNKRGEYSFWFKNEDNDWERASFLGIIEFLSQGIESLVTSKSTKPDIFKDKYLFSKFPNHHGYQLVSYVLDRL